MCDAPAQARGVASDLVLRSTRGDALSYADYQEPYNRPDPHVITQRNAGLQALGTALVLVGLVMLGLAVALFV